MALASSVPSPAVRSRVPRPRPRKAIPLDSRTEPRLSVVVVNYCQWRSTARLARQVLRSAAARRGLVEVVIVDNHSPPHPLIRRLRRWPGVSVRRWRQNRGFARAANEGCRLSRGRWVLLLNPDIEVPEGFVDGALELGERLGHEEPRAGIIGFQLRNRDASPQGSAGAFPTLLSTLLGLVRPRACRKYRPVAVRHRSAVSWVTGCCLLVRRECLQELGGFDQRFFLYYEDVDLCRRARALGWSVWHDPSLWVVHQHPLHGRVVPPYLRCILRHALVTYASQHWPAWQFQLLVGVVRLEAWFRGCWARWCGRKAAAKQFTALGNIATEMAANQPQAARRRLGRLVRRCRSQAERDMSRRDDQAGTAIPAKFAAGGVAATSPH